MKTCMQLFGAPQAQQEASSSLEICLRMVSETCMAPKAAQCLCQQIAILVLSGEASALITAD